MLQAGVLAIEKQRVTLVDRVDENGEVVKDENDRVIQDRLIDWEPVLLAGMDDVSSELYTEDDNAAQAAYEHKSLLIQAQDKQLDVELKQIETQLEACKAEKESVQKLVNDRAKEDFKLFG